MAVSKYAPLSLLKSSWLQGQARSFLLRLHDNLACWLLSFAPQANRRNNDDGSQRFALN